MMQRRLRVISHARALALYNKFITITNEDDYYVFYDKLLMKFKSTNDLNRYMPFVRILLNHVDENQYIKEMLLAICYFAGRVRSIAMTVLVLRRTNNHVEFINSIFDGAMEEINTDLSFDMYELAKEISPDVAWNMIIPHIGIHNLSLYYLRNAYPEIREKIIELYEETIDELLDERDRAHRM